MVHFYPWFKYYFLLLQTCHHTLHITIPNDKTEKNYINDKNSSLYLQLLLLCTCDCIGLLCHISMKCNRFYERKLKCDFLHGRKKFWCSHTLFSCHRAYRWLGSKRKWSMTSFIKKKFFRCNTSCLFFWRNRWHLTFMLWSTLINPMTPFFCKISFDEKKSKMIK